MKSFKFYIKSANYFLNPPNYMKLDAQEKEYNYIASTLLSWICLESYVNMACESLSYGKRLQEHQKAYLEEYELKLNDNGIFHKCKIHPSTTKKILFILQYFSKIDIQKFKQTKMWKDIKAFENLRNKIVHNKEKEKFSISLKKAQSLRDLIQEMIDYLNGLLFRKK